jgi:uridine phosphorylase
MNTHFFIYQAVLWNYFAKGCGNICVEMESAWHFGLISVKGLETESVDVGTLKYSENDSKAP